MKKIFTLLFISFTLSGIQAQTALDFSFTDVDGVEHKLSDALAEDKVVLLDFFFVDCPPCIALAPEIDALIADYDFEGTTVEVWAISDRDSNEKIKGSVFNSTHPNHFVGGVEGMGAEAVELYSSNFSFYGFPTYSIICKDNSITWDIWPLTEGIPEIRDNMTEDCGVVAPTVSSIVTVEGLSGVEIAPNPAVDYAVVNFNLTVATDLDVTLYNNLGQAVKRIANQKFDAGVQSLDLNTADLSAGMYTLRLQSQEGTSSVQVMVSK